MGRWKSRGTFAYPLARVRAGDEPAAAELLKLYEPRIRRVVRVRFATSPRSLRRQMDSTDICQSVMGDFFVRAAMGQFDLDSPAQLVGLLAKMAQNKVIGHARRQRAARRDVRRWNRAERTISPWPATIPRPRG